MQALFQKGGYHMQVHIATFCASQTILQTQKFEWVDHHNSNLSSVKYPHHSTKSSPIQWRLTFLSIQGFERCHPNHGLETVVVGEFGIGQTVDPLIPKIKRASTQHILQYLNKLFKLPICLRVRYSAKLQYSPVQLLYSAPKLRSKSGISIGHNASQYSM
jgi:hypothetical protein